MRSEDPMSLLSGWSIMRGEYRHQVGARSTSLVLDPRSGSAEQNTIGEQEGEFPIVGRRDVAQCYEHVLCVERSAERAADVPGFNQIVLVNVESGAADRFSYGDGWLVEEHLHIDAPDDVAPRWIVGTALDMRADNTVLSVFDAAHVSDGPIAQARLPSPPRGLHGTFRPETACP